MPRPDPPNHFCRELDTIAVERCFRALVRKLFDTQEEGRSARGFEGVALMSEFFGFPACRFGEKYHAARRRFRSSQLSQPTEAASPEACGLGALAVDLSPAGRNYD